MSSNHSKGFADMSKKFDFLVFIGRFQPFHRGHLSVIETALAQSSHVIVLCGSAHRPRSVRNPWSTDERREMVLSAIAASERDRVHVLPLMDILYNDEAWIRNVQATVSGVVTAYHGQPHKQARIGLVGHSKDHSSYYLNLFPQWGSISVENYRGIASTTIRQAFFSEALDEYLHGAAGDELTPGVEEYLQSFSRSDAYSYILDEQNFIQKYQSAWAGAPYAPTFVTVDAVVVQSGHVLMVERKARPGRGQMALPGGFVGDGERLDDACIRELREETRIKVPAPVLRGSIRDKQVFDDPHRSERGRTITHAYYLELNPDSQLPRVKGGDDAKHAFWVPLASLDPSRIFEDHYFIIRELAGM